MNTMFHFTSKQMGKIILRFTDRSVLLLELAHNGRVIPFAGHEESENLLPVFGHNEL